MAAEETKNNVTVTDNPDEQRYELRVDDDVIGVADYYDRDGIRVIPHTEVRPSHEGQGLGATLVRFALDDIRTHGMSVRPACPFVATYLKRHPEYADLAG